jgi:hypothetical protein
MAIDAHSYGSTAGVAALTPRYANGSGVFDGTTRPTLTQVESFIDQVSSVLNTLLAENGFNIPVSQADAVRALSLFVNQEAAAIVEGVNGSGRFGPVQGGRPVQASRFTLIMRDVAEFISVNAAGFERLGATRTYSLTEGIAFRDSDEAGEATFPLFQRKSFGGETFVDADA